jgi:aspartate/methionine/tyrosine aminotransferase
VKGIELSPIREVVAKIEDTRRKGIEVINFSIGRPDFDTPIHIKLATKEALDRDWYTIHIALAP